MGDMGVVSHTETRENKYHAKQNRIAIIVLNHHSTHPAQDIAGF